MLWLYCAASSSPLSLFFFPPFSSSFPAYNGISAAAWIYIAAVALMEYTGSGVDGVWAKVEEPLKWVSEHRQVYRFVPIKIFNHNSKTRLLTLSTARTVPSYSYDAAFLKRSLVVLQRVLSADASRSC